MAAGSTSVPASARPASVSTSNVQVEALDQRGNAGRIFVGWRASRHLGAELIAYDLGEVQSAVSAQVVDVDAFERTLDRELPFLVSGLALTGNLFLPLGPGGAFDLLVKVGLMRWEGEVRVQSGDSGTRITPVSGEDALFGLGLDYHLGQRLSLRLEHERILVDVPDEVDFTSLGLYYRF